MLLVLGLNSARVTLTEPQWAWDSWPEEQHHPTFLSVHMLLRMTLCLNKSTVGWGHFIFKILVHATVAQRIYKELRLSYSIYLAWSKFKIQCVFSTEHISFGIIVKSKNCKMNYYCKAICILKKIVCSKYLITATIQSLLGDIYESDSLICTCSIQKHFFISNIANL